jgi:glycogen phosphorylase
VTHGDRFMHLADLASYVGTQEQVGALYLQPDAWARRAILNVACSGKFSSDRTIAEYARDIWGAQPCPVDSTVLTEQTRGNLDGHPSLGRSTGAA